MSPRAIAGVLTFVLGVAPGIAAADRSTPPIPGRGEVVVTLREEAIVLSGAYRCVGPGVDHTLVFTSSGLNPVSLETRLGNLDAGDCYIIANLLLETARAAGCTTRPAVPLPPQDEATLDLLCTGTRSSLVALITRLGVIALTYQQPQP